MLAGHRQGQHRRVVFEAPKEEVCSPPEEEKDVILGDGSWNVCLYTCVCAYVCVCMYICVCVCVLTYKKVHSFIHSYKG